MAPAALGGRSQSRGLARPPRQPPAGRGTRSARRSRNSHGENSGAPGKGRGDSGMGVFKGPQERGLRGELARFTGRARVPVKESRPIRRANGFHARHGPEHVRRAGQVSRNPSRMVHSRDRLHGHLAVRDVGHEALGVAEVHFPHVKQRAGHGSLRVGGSYSRTADFALWGLLQARSTAASVRGSAAPCTRPRSVRAAPLPRRSTP